VTGPPPADSAGRPWSGRSFEANAWAADDGTAPPAYLQAITALHGGEAGPAAVIDALRPARLLVPLVADLAEAGEADGRIHDKRAELALPTVAGPDGRTVLPAFTSAEAMARWRPGARPIPAPARQVALGAAGDGTELVIVDPGSPTQFGLRRSAVEALARDLPWSPPWEDPDVVGAIRAIAVTEPAVGFARVGADDPLCLLDGAAEVQVLLGIVDRLDREELTALIGRLQRSWAEAAPVARVVDSIRVRVEAGVC
jgi:SseB protein N-terminal domain